MEGFFDIEGTEISEGDLVVWVMRNNTKGQSDRLAKGIVTKFSELSIWIGQLRIEKAQTKRRVLVMNGIKKEYKRIK
jgi:hypothetical protein